MTDKAAVTVVDQSSGEIVEVDTGALSVSSAYIQETVKSLTLLQDMTRNILKRGRDYGRTPGTPQDGLWDPGASLIIGSFGCYIGQRRIIHLVDDEKRISVVVEVPVISRASGREVGSGVGAASTLESKYHYRWFYPEELRGMGYTKEQLHSLKTDKKHEGRFRIENPDHGELLNTLVKQSSKRAEVDAAEALPGVASVLRELFDPKLQKQQPQQPDWNGFWSQADKLGIASDDIHKILGVNSMKDWLQQGKSLNDAVKTIADKLALKGSAHPPVPPTAPQSTKRDPTTITTMNELYKACNQDFMYIDKTGNARKMQPDDVVRELGYLSPTYITESPAECYARIAAARQ